MPINAQELDSSIDEMPLPEERQEDDTLAPDSVFIINSFNFNIKGFTRRNALIYNGEFKKGEIIKGTDNLEKYIRDKTQALMNERVLESVTINYSIAEQQEDGMYPVDLLIDIKDTWNIIVLPRPKYSSNTGFELILKARDYNFLGTMSPLRFDLGYIHDEEGKNSLTMGLDFIVPFRVFNLNWNIKFNNQLDYRPDTDEPFFYMNTIGLSVELPVKFTTLIVGFDEAFYFNEENSDIDKPFYGNFQKGLYMSSIPYISWKIPTGFYIGSFGELVYTPILSAVFNHEFKEWPLNDNKKGPELILNNNLGFKHIDWIVNFQKGVSFFIDNSFRYNFFKSNHELQPKLNVESFTPDEQPWEINLQVSGIGHFIITNFFGVSTRLMYRHWFLQENGYNKAGDVLRGIIDKDIQADYMVSLNLDFPVRILRFTPSIWLNKPKLRFFNFDLHLSPIIDTALFHSPNDDSNIDSKNIIVTGGLEAIIFPEFFRSLFLRFSFGWNFRKALNTGNMEIYIGTDFHY